MEYEYLNAQGRRRRIFGVDYRFVVGFLVFLLLAAFSIFFEVVRTHSANVPQQVAEHPWWKTSIVYQIYAWSFQDSDGDGNGDLKGITSRADYLKDLGIGAVWLTPIYPSPMVDFGYDITNFIDVDPIFGTLEDFDEMLSELKSRGIKVIMDFVPNHTSDQHKWFLKSIEKVDPYTDYYMWKDPKGFNATGHPIPPNNWISVYGSTWEWNKKRQQFYLHNYEKKQPDLNVRNPVVMDELDNAIKFWLDRGVYGIRLDAVSRLFEVEDVYRDEPVNEKNIGKVDPNYRSYLREIYTTNQPETLDAVRRWRKILDTYDDRMMVAEVSGTLPQYMPFYGTEEAPLADFPFNFFFIIRIKDRSQFNGENLKKIIDDWLIHMPQGKWPNWVVGNHDGSRVNARIGTDLLDAVNMIVLLLKGTAFTYYGEEIGMENTPISYEDTRDPRGKHFGPELYKKFTRDPARTPMQWNNSINAGFSTARKTWLPLNQNYETLNVAAQLKAPQSHLKVYKSLVQLRRERTFTHGGFDFASATKDVLAFVRHLKGEDSYLVVVNTSNGSMTLDLSAHSDYPLPRRGTVVVRSSFDFRIDTQPGLPISLALLSLLPGEGLVINLSCNK